MCRWQWNRDTISAREDSDESSRKVQNMGITGSWASNKIKTAVGK